jgi:hypothetical protein
MLVAVDGATYEEAARACNCPVGTIRSRIHRARIRLAAQLSAESPASHYRHLTSPSPTRQAAGAARL